MNEIQIEDMLRRYRPTGPPAGLRELCLARAQRVQSWPWVVAATVLLGLFGGLHRENTRIFNQAGIQSPPDPDAGAVNELSDFLRIERRMAAVLIAEQQVDADRRVLEPQDEIPSGHR